jgi:hypothetical protein
MFEFHVKYVLRLQQFKPKLNSPESYCRPPMLNFNINLFNILWRCSILTDRLTDGSINQLVGEWVDGWMDEWTVITSFLCFQFL